MKLSIVSAGRNDNYGGDFEERVLRAFDRNRVEASVDVEWVFVEWNPTDNPYLSEKLARLYEVRCYVVDPAIHERLTDPEQGMVYHANFAKNVGLRRATGDWILSTNPDVVIGPEVWDFLACSACRAGTLYRAERRDINPDMFGYPFDIMERNTVRLFSLDKSITYAAGDFILFSAANRMGFDESVNFSGIHLDSSFVKNWDGPVERIPGGKVYKADHPMVAARTLGTDKWQRGKRKWHIKPYQNPDNWGLADHPKHRLARNITYIEEL